MENERYRFTQIPIRLQSDKNEVLNFVLHHSFIPFSVRLNKYDEVGRVRGKSKISLMDWCIVSKFGYDQWVDWQFELLRKQVKDIIDSYR